jgi:hypothetical protein
MSEEIMEGSRNLSVFISLVFFRFSILNSTLAQVKVSKTPILLMMNLKIPK